MAQQKKIQARAGGAVVEIDQAAVIAQADRMLEGAVSTFLRAAHRQADPVVQEARTRGWWPVRTGRSVAGVNLEDRISVNALEVVAQNAQPYAYKIRFSVVTRETIQREPSEVANRVWAKLGPKVERGTTEKARRAIARKFINEDSGGLIGGWWYRRDPSARAIRDIWAAQLKYLHGDGAPNEKVAGRNVWNELVRKPMRKREKHVIEEARAALDRLAKG